MATKKWNNKTLIVLLGIWGFISFILLISEDNPFNPAPLAQFLIIKAVAIISLLACSLTAKYLDKKGYFADMEDEV